MRAEIIGTQAVAMRNIGLDALICCSPENFAYCTGFVVPSQPLIRHRHAMALVKADATTALFCVDMEATTVRNREPDLPMTVWAEFSDDPMAVLADMFTREGLSQSAIGI